MNAKPDSTGNGNGNGNGKRSVVLLTSGRSDVAPESAREH